MSGTVLSSFDIYAVAGDQNKAIARSFTTTRTSSGEIVIQFTAGTENPKINDIYIQPGSGLQVLIITFNAIAEGTSALGLYVDQLVDGTPATIGPACGNDSDVTITYRTMLGDTNSDGVVDSIDALLVARYYVKLEPPGFIPENADTNCDGNIDSGCAFISSILC